MTDLIMSVLLLFTSNVDAVENDPREMSRWLGTANYIQQDISEDLATHIISKSPNSLFVTVAGPINDVIPFHNRLLVKEIAKTAYLTNNSALLSFADDYMRQLDYTFVNGSYQTPISLTSQYGWSSETPINQNAVALSAWLWVYNAQLKVNNTVNWMAKNRIESLSKWLSTRIEPYNSRLIWKYTDSLSKKSDYNHAAYTTEALMEIYKFQPISWVQRNSLKNTTLLMMSNSPNIFRLDGSDFPNNINKQSNIDRSYWNMWRYYSVFEYHPHLKNILKVAVSEMKNISYSEPLMDFWADNLNN